MIEDIQILEAVERYISGQMSPDERVYFEQLRKSNPEIDQAVVEHTFFLQQMNRFDGTRQLKGILNDTHIHLAEKGLIRSPRLKGRAKVVYLFNRYKKTAAIAASIAGITALTMSALIWSLSPGKPAKQEDLVQLKRGFDNEIKQIKKQNQALDQKIENVKEQNTIQPVIQYTSGGTGFLIDTKGYLVTNAHVVDNARHIAVQNANGKDLSATIIYKDAKKDIAILKITDKSFKSPSSIPYGIKRSGGDLAERIFTLGYPRNDIVYGDGYIAARTGYNGDTLACQIDIPANRGNSGSPILNKNGEIIGVISNKQNAAEGAVFAIHSKYIFDAISQLQKDTAYRNISLPQAASIRSAERTKQVEKISDFVYMVKVN
ncbi:MAG TPA: serine protease [Flavisolibacter sp.]|nr:serine protease [Flavisolibacter sp.]